ncbi:RagB/SusD family nutrient uptake outer membrane protein [Flectobacillus longus]|uniref:RagB/SusD family nutrient uptake outer membrane protein n=1 Tax=Flectobacillus longus TaxID=2984207 RepID=UPI0024B6D16A|nr:RagB/SusD family nutrient uptake outer membrane protein [Flectobacillus longus]MDI9882662.1 RagB/SusD family nutrient uptake outer membrane protein [Flectobacillus longus]
MKLKYFFVSLLAISSLILTSCEDKFLNLEPLDQATESIYFTKATDFKAASNAFYPQMIGFRPTNSSNIYDFVDSGSDLTAGVSNIGQGGNAIPATDIYWRNAYNYIRANNYLIQKGTTYTGSQAEIKQYISAAYFFRAWNYFFLLKRYGGVPLVTTVIDLNDDILYGARNTRYEVVAQILSDLDMAIGGLPAEAAIAATDKGQVSLQAAKAFKARVLLYEATWEKYVGESTDFTQGQKKADKTTAYFTEAADLASQVMADNTYQLFNGLDSLSYYYLFTLDDAQSNPKGLTKASNKEYILKSSYDFTLLQGNANLSHTLSTMLAPSRKMMDMYLCTDGLPFKVSPLAKGYVGLTDEFQNRDARLKSIINTPGRKYWGRGASAGADYTKANYTTLNNWPTIITAYYPNLSTNSSNPGYDNRKFVSEHPNRADYQESYDYPQIRLAEVYLIYAEAKCELGGGKISDTDLNLSINKIRARAYVAPLTNALIAPYASLTMLGEIRRERALELYGENTRFDDLKRWGIAEAELNQSVLGKVVSVNGKPTEVATMINPVTKSAIYKSSIYILGVDNATGALIMDPASNRKFAKKHYLLPLPTDQLLLNNKLQQNPGW